MLDNLFAIYNSFKVCCDKGFLPKQKRESGSEGELMFIYMLNLSRATLAKEVKNSNNQVDSLKMLAPADNCTAIQQ